MTCIITVRVGLIRPIDFHKGTRWMTPIDFEVSSLKVKVIVILDTESISSQYITYNWGIVA